MRWRLVCAQLMTLATLAASGAVARAQEPLTLAKALELGKQRSPEIVAAKARYDSASANAEQGKAGYLPTLSATLQAQEIAVRSSTPDFANPVTRAFTDRSHTEQGVASAAFRWNAWDFGKTSSTVASLQATANAANANVDVATVQFASDVATAYVTFYYKEELRKAAIQTVENRDKLLTFAKALVKSGLQPPLEEIRAGSRLEAAKRDLANAEADALDARAALATILKLDAPFRVAEPHLPSVETDVARAAHTAEEKRETVRAARANVDAKRAGTDAARARYLPTLSFNMDASYTLAQYDLYANGALPTTRFLGAVVLSGPLFDYSIPTGVDQAQADAANAEAILSQTARDARGEGIRAAIAVRAADNIFEHAKKAADAANNVFTIVQARYQQGLSTPLEVIDAETQDVSARQDRITAELNKAQSVIRLLLATGQGNRIYQESR